MKPVSTASDVVTASGGLSFVLLLYSSILLPFLSLGWLGEKRSLAMISVSFCFRTGGGVVVVE